MWAVTDTNLSMAEGDYGIKLPIIVHGAEFAASDTLRFTFLEAPNKREILQKEYTEIEQNTVNLEFLESESSLFTPGNYYYRLDWYQSGNFMCNIIPQSIFRVVDKA